MRVAFSGSHRVGKSTLLDAVAEHLPSYATVPEPYELLVEEGHDFCDPPTADDFELQLARSLELVEDDPRKDILFDRCPIDFLAYLGATDEHLSVAGGVDDIRAALATLDLIVFVPIEEPDRIAVPEADDRRLRRDVNELLQELLLDDPHALGVRVLEVSGSVDARVRAVLAALR
jgi:predicted ATPase